MKNKKYSEKITIISTLLIIASISFTIFTSQTTLMFFKRVAIYSLPGTIIGILMYSEYVYTLKKENMIDENREKINNINFILMSFVNIPFILIYLYKIMEALGKLI